ncbi:MAG: polyprenyl synthetase family protein [Cucumibacter sp.]
MHALLADIEACAAETEAFLEDYLSASNAAFSGAPARLMDAMRYGALGGKRLRPYLLRAGAGLFGIPAKATLRAGAAVECVHCYSLIHDDLPDMDNDALRRGRSSVWAAYDPATAILAGDALLTLAFSILADSETHPDPGIRIALIRRLALGAGAGGMAGGQMADIEAEKSRLDEAETVRMQRLKTGALIEAAIGMGAILGGASETETAALTRYAAATGLAFQLADDILDVTQSSETLGKTAGKDRDRNKSTLVGLLGIDEARARLDASVAEAVAALDLFEKRAERLRDLARYFAVRES